MAEAEDVLQDAARHATIYVRGLWARHRKPDGKPPAPALADFAHRIDLLVTAACGRSFPLRIAQPPAPPTLLARLFRRSEGPPHRDALPATDGARLWLPARLDGMESAAGATRYRVLALQQALRARRGGPVLAASEADPLASDLFLLAEADAADAELVRDFPGLWPALAALRGECLEQRPPLDGFPPHLRAVELHLRECLAVPPTAADEAGANLEAARALARMLREQAGREDFGPRPLFRDTWTGEFRIPTPVEDIDGSPGAPSSGPQRSAQLPRSPRVREASEDEDDDQPGAWMIQPGEPLEQAEDPAGLQRPTDRDQDTAADELADMLSELPEARLMAAPGRPAEVLLSEDPPDPRSRLRPHDTAGDSDGRTRIYPEWDWRSQDYDPHGATVHLLPAVPGPQAWVDDTLRRHRGMLDEIRRRFEMLRARRVRLHRRPDGDEIDIDALVAARGEFAAGLPLPQNVYLEQRRARRDMAVLLLIDVSGSTDGWISGARRVIDVEREALLLVCVALEGLGHPYAVQAFSGEGPHGVIVRDVKGYDEAFCGEVALRIAGLEPESYTRAGAALRHASNLLMRQAAEHRLLLLLSDGKPNDMDRYEGRYGVEDLRQAVTEARLQGISPFCLTIDRQGAAYLPQVFGPGHYALLPRPDLLPRVLLDWLRRLVGN